MTQREFQYHVYQVSDRAFGDGIKRNGIAGLLYLGRYSIGDDNPIEEILSRFNVGEYIVVPVESERRFLVAPRTNNEVKEVE